MEGGREQYDLGGRKERLIKVRMSKVYEVQMTLPPISCHGTCHAQLFPEIGKVQVIRSFPKL